MRYKKGNEKKRLINNEIVRVRDNKKRDLFVIFVFIFSAALLLLFYLWQRLGNVELAYKIDRLKKEFAAEQEKNNGLKLQFESLSDLDRINKIAVSSLGMIIPKKDEIFITKRVKVRLETSETGKLAYASKLKARIAPEESE
jgi:cell division protein FtsL